MTILKGLWKLLVGVKDLLVLIFMVVLFGTLIAVVNREAPTPQVADGGALVVPMAGVLVSQAQDVDPFALIAGGSPVDEIDTYDLIRTIRAAAKDDRVPALVLEMDGFFGGGQSNVEDVANAVAAFKESGKPVYSFATAYLDDAWLIAVHGTETWLAPMGTVLVQGPGGSNLYFGDALDKLKVDVNVFRVGTFKSAVEPYTSSEASEPAKRARQVLADDLWEIYQQDVAAARPQAKLMAYVNDMPGAVRSAGGDFATAALAAGLVDKLGTRAEFETMLSDKFGGSDDGPLPYDSTDLYAYQSAMLTPPEAGPAIGVVTVAGNIIDGEAPAGTAGGTTISTLIADAAANDDIKALVLRVDSPGGSVLASEEIRQSLLMARKDGLPVIASFGPVAASGGYWISTAAEAVIAEPSTITGSIGVFSIVPSFDRTLADLGINADGVKTTPLSGAPDVFAGLDPSTRDLLQLSVEDIYTRFVKLVADARDIPVERVEEIAEGRVWSGAAARQLGLVDRFGTLDDAISLAAERAGYDADDIAVIRVREPKPFAQQIAEELLASGGNQEAAPESALAVALARRQMEGAAALGDAVATAKTTSMQARCLDCTTGPRIADVDLPGWLATLKSLLP